MLLLSKSDIKKVFTMRDAIEADKEAFKIYTEGKSVVPLRTNIPAPKEEGSMLFMPGYIEDLDCAGVKIVSVFPNNIKKGKPVTPATVLLMDGITGEVSAILDGTYITQLRTGAASGAAIDVLARKDAKKGALIGTGGQAASQLEAMIEARNLEEVYIYDIDLDRTNKFVNQMQEELSNYNTKFKAAKSSDEAIEDADVIITVTTSKKPVFDGNKVKKGATISAVGSYLPVMQELDPVALTRANKIFFESTDAVLSESGDILNPLENGTITKYDFSGELGQVINNEILGRENDEEIIVFKTVGIAVQDVVTAKKIYDKAIEKNVGTQW
ncbi:ornithine cyclodeaminase family protein [Paraclostridium sordellii 8483]|uniref:ornithine cyclodeaminase family protein n=1 Tax=Paraclostridium sordellii TaxID=1505 RepID=UPI0002F389EE|nr:ornithine cyclodeaminase family protein [Paeniclostridium sordellii]TAN66207.1 ornithine cyclodeaminase family protein [Paeniclostridium sordellii 8483]